MYRKRTSLVPVATAVIASLAACASPAPSGGASSPEVEHIVNFTGPTWSNVSALADRADFVFIGSVSGLYSKEIDSGGNESDVGGVPVAFYTVSMERVLKGKTPQSSDIYVGWPDTSEMLTHPPTSELSPGDRVVMFTEHLTTADAPGIDTVSDFYVPLGYDNGTFNVSDDHVTPRSQLVSRLIPGGPTASSWTVAEIQAALSGAK